VLYDWKKEMANDGVLSVRELLRRTGDIERHFEIGIGRLTARLS